MDKQSIKAALRTVLVMIRANIMELVEKHKVPLEKVREYLDAIKTGFNEAIADYLKDNPPS